MTISLTTDQATALGLESRHKVTAIKIDRTTDLLYCTGVDPVTLAGDLYMPRGLNVSGLVTGDPANSRARVVLDDADGVVGASWYSERMSGCAITITDATRVAGAWVVTSTNVLTINTVQRAPEGTLVLDCVAAEGYNPTACLIAGTRLNFHLAPEPGESIRIGATTARL